MSGSGAFSRETDLTGVWTGEYWYQFGGDRTSFAAHVTDTGGSLSGTTLEPATFGAGLGDLSANITGARDGASVDFTKIYDPVPGVHQNPILYSGTVNSDLAVIDGGWVFRDHGTWRGGFQMRRTSPRTKAAAKREATKTIRTKDVVVEIHKRRLKPPIKVE
ncbi:MAG: hypothetical protein Q8R02_13010 [Hyphomonadaceae bacterium]|nr:hypothetical protein [Hyphomonadaceae bacterium]